MYHGKYIADVFESTETKEEFIQVIKNNGALYYYADSELDEIWEALARIHDRMVMISD